MIHCHFKKVEFHSEPAKAAKALGLPRSPFDRPITPAERRSWNAISYACRFSKAVVLLNFNEDIAVVFRPSVFRGAEATWEHVPYSFSVMLDLEDSASGGLS